MPKMAGFAVPTQTGASPGLLWVGNWPPAGPHTEKRPNVVKGGTVTTALKASVLAVDDDPGFVHLVREILKPEEYGVESAASGDEALRLLTREPERFFLVLLDLNMPGLDGFTTCEQIRGFSSIPIIVITGRETESDKVRGLELGADDYIVKPVSPIELTARVRAVLRRASAWAEADGLVSRFRSGELVIDFDRFEVSVQDRPIRLSTTEYRLIAYLARNAGRLLTPNQILQHVWGGEYVGESHLLRVTIGRLRRRLGDDARNPRFILNHPGLGYMIAKADP